MRGEVIPGYFYDPQKKRYFKIEKHELPDFVTQFTVASQSASDLASRCLQNIENLIRPSERASFISLIDRFERRGCSSGSLASDYSRMNLRHFQTRSSLAVQSISHCLLSSSGDNLYGTSFGSFNSYRLFWSSRPRRQKRQRWLPEDNSNSHANGTGIFNIRSSSHSVLPGLIQDWRWCRSGSTILALCNTGGGSGLMILTFQKTSSGFQYTWEPDTPIRLPCINSARLVFHAAALDDCEDASSGVKSDSEFYDGTVLVCTRGGVYRLGHGVHYPVYTTRRKNCRRFEPKMSITACSGMCSDSLRTSAVPLYLSTTSTNGDRKFNLIQLDAFDSTQPHVLLTFGSCTEFSSDITHIEPFVSRMYSTRTVLTRSRTGLMQLWDGRWPHQPILSYRGSDCDRLHSLASHIAPQPVIDLETFGCVACPLPACSSIAFWDVWSGNPIHLLNYNTGCDRSVFTPPPQLFLRSTWPNVLGEQVHGPGMLLVDQTEISWFCAS